MTIDYFRVENDISEIFQPIVLSLFTWSLLAISAALLIIQVNLVECILMIIRTVFFKLFKLLSISVETW